MATPPPPPKTAAPESQDTGTTKKRPTREEPEIVTIPEKFYGQALKMKAEEKKEEPKPKPKEAKPPTPQPPIAGPKKRRPIWPFALIIILLLLIIGGGFVYFNRDLLFREPAPTPPPAEPEEVVPTAATNLTATHSTGTNAVNLRWVDTSDDETGYRIERREEGGTFLPLTNLSINSTTFLDVTVQPETGYTYRVFATSPAGESMSSNEANVTTAAVAERPERPGLPPGGLDSDSDGISDEEERVFGTDTATPDTDGDGFLDGNEVFHLYNPGAEAPIRLVDSGLVNEIRASAGWRLFAPRQWVSTLVPPDGAEATIRTGTGETFEVAILDNPENLILRDWYSQNEQAITSSGAVRNIVTKGGLQGILGADRLSAFFAWDGKIFVIRYNLGEEAFINYRTTFEMMLNSLELQGAPILTETDIDEAEDGPGTFIETSQATSTESVSTSSETGT